jgi:hypothetical protein
MAVLEILIATVQGSPLQTIAAVTVFSFFARCIYRIYFHPLAHIPGPAVAKITSLWLHYHAYIGDEASAIHALHKTYGSLLRVAPNHVDIGDADAIQAIYVTGGGFPKAQCYQKYAKFETGLSEILM